MVPDGWKIESIGSIARVTTGGTPSKAKSEFWEPGTIPWVRTTEVQNCTIDKIDIPVKISKVGLAHSSTKIVPSGTILMALIGQGKTRGQVALLKTEAAINQNCAAIILNESQNPEFFFNFLLSQYEKIRGISNSAGQSNLNGATVKAIQVTVPPLQEQDCIAKIFSVWDAAIERMERLIAVSQQHKRALMAVLLSGARRLSGFSEEWQPSQLSSHLTEVTERNRNSAVTRVLSVTNHSGFILPEDHFSKRIASADVSNYKIVREGQYGYNPSRINVGSFARLDEYPEGILSPMYVVFQVDPTTLNNDYFLEWMSSDEARQRILANTQGSVRDSVSFDALCEFPILLPSVGEQAAIARVLKSANAEISTLQNLLQQLRHEKTALMQQLLTGKRRVKLKKEAAA